MSNSGRDKGYAFGSSRYITYSYNALIPARSPTKRTPRIVPLSVDEVKSCSVKLFKTGTIPIKNPVRNVCNELTKYLFTVCIYSVVVTVRISI